MGIGLNKNFFRTLRLGRGILPIAVGGPSYLLNDSFNDDRASGSVHGTPATPGPGTRDAKENNGGIVAIAGGYAEVTGGDTSYNDGNLSWNESFSRVPGRVLVWGDVVLSNGGATFFGVDGDQDLQFLDNYWRVAGSLLRPNGANVLPGTASNYENDNLSMVLGLVNSYFFMQTDGAGDWRLVWISSVGSDDSLYAGYAQYASVTDKFSFLRVPEATWLPTPLAYTEFAAANGTSLDALNTLTTGPDGQAGVTSRSWTEYSGEWQIQSNKCTNQDFAAATHEAAAMETGEADVVIDCDIGMPASNAGPSICFRLTDNTHYWVTTLDVTNNEIRIWENDGGFTQRGATAVAINQSTTYSARVIADGQQIDCFIDGGNKVSYGSASFNETATKHGAEGYSNLTDDTTWENYTIFARDSGYSQLDKYTR